MLHVIYGKDREKGRARFRVLRDALSKKCGGESPVLEGEISDDFIKSAIASQGLFGETTLFVFDCVFDKKVEQEILLENADSLVSSSNIFLIFEPALEKSIVDGLSKAKAITEECGSKKINTRPDFNIFSLGDALGKKNKKELWILYQEAVSNSLSPEEISGTLFWAIKNLALAKGAMAGDDAGMSPFVANKNRDYQKNYTQEEIQNMSHSLTALYHEAHMGGEPMDIALERFILSL